MEANKEQPFFVVWCLTKSVPTVQHRLRENAEREASRLADLNPGERFYTLEACSYAIKPPPITLVSLRDSDDDGIPF